MRSSGDTEGDVQRVLSKLEASGSDVTVVRMIANSANAFRPFVLFSDSLMSRSTLPAAVREVVILHLAVRQGQSYEWYEHEAMSDRAGVTAAQRDAIRAGEITTTAFSEEEVLAVQAADELLDARSLSDATWSRLKAAFGADGTLDLVLAIGWWGGLVPLALNALQLEDPRAGRDDLPSGR